MSNKELLRRLSFRLGLALLVLGGAIYLGGFGAASIGDTWLGTIVAGAGVLVLGIHIFLNRSN